MNTRKACFLGLCALLGWAISGPQPAHAQSLTLNGDLDYASAEDTSGELDPTDTLDIRDNTFCLELWVRHDGQSAEDARLVDKTTGSASTGGYEMYFLGESDEPQLEFNLPATFASITSRQGIPAGRWTHVAVSYDGNEIALYINGQLDNSFSLDGSVQGNALPFVVGANTGLNGQFFSGEIDELRLWNDARTLLEIQENQYNELSGNEQGLRAYYSFNSIEIQQDLVRPNNTEGPALELAGNWGTGKNALPTPPDLYVLNEGNSQVGLEIRPRIDASDPAAADSFVLTRGVDTTDINIVDTLVRSKSLRYTDSSVFVQNNNPYLYRSCAGQDFLFTPKSFGPAARARPRASSGTAETPQGGSALALDGEQDYGLLSDRPSLDIADNTFSLELWLKHDGQSDPDARLVDKTTGSASSGGYEMYFLGEGEEPRLEVSIPAAFSSITSNKGLPAGRWHHVAVSYDGSELALYINGQLDNSSSLGGDVENNDLPFVVGANTALNDQFFSGRIDELALWDDARTKSEIQQSYRHTLKGYEDALMAYWRFNAPQLDQARGHTFRHSSMTLKGDATTVSGGVFPLAPFLHARQINDSILVELGSRYNTAKDCMAVYRGRLQSGSVEQVRTIATGGDTSVQATLPATPGMNLNDTSIFFQATSFNGQSQESDLGAPLKLSFHNTRLGNALSLDGNNDYGLIADRPSLDIFDPTMTLEVWINYESGSASDAIIVDKTDGAASTNGYELRLKDAGDSAQVTLDLPNTFSEPTSNAYIQAGTWNHVAVAYDGNDLTFYINGQEDKQIQPGGSVGGSGLPLVVGANTSSANSQFFSGRIDELRLWEDARTQSEIQAHYQQELIGNEQGLKAYWRFNETAGDTAARAQAIRLKTMRLFGDADFRDNPILTDVERVAQKPEQGHRLTNTPNPVRAQTTIRYVLPERSQVRLSVYTLQGKRVAQLVRETQRAGTYQVDFQAGDLPSGLYLYRLETRDHRETRRMSVLR